MPRAASRCLALLAALSLCACVARQPIAPAELELVLLPPAELGNELLVKQKVTMLAGERSQQFLAVARFEAERLRLVVLLPSGQRLSTLEYDGVTLQQESAAEVELPGREMLAVMQFATWPADSIRRHYPSGKGWRVEISASQRRLLTEFGIALNIAYQPRAVSIDNYFKEYRVIVETLEKTEL